MEGETLLEPPLENLEAAKNGGCNLDSGFAAELEAYQGLQLDFDTEFADFLSRDLPNNNNRVRRSSSIVSSTNSSRRVEYNADGTINCCEINYDAICIISGRTSLDHLTSLTLSVACQNSSDNLSALSYCTPGLTTLRLDNSRIQSLRVLGDELNHLKTLSVCYCGLEDLDGISYAPNLVTLVAADNHITDVLPITELRRIHTLDLENNAFEDYGSISFLFICPKLENLVLQGNPISHEENYRPTIFRILPMLKNLDIIIAPRAPKTLCKKDSKFYDDETDNAGAPTVTDIPKELEDVIEPDGVKPKPVEKENPLEDNLIQKLIHQTSDDANDNSTEAIDDEQEVKDDNDHIVEEQPDYNFRQEEGDVFEIKEDYFEDMSRGDESLSMSLSVATPKEAEDDPPRLEEYDNEAIPDECEIVEESEKEEEVPEPTTTMESVESTEHVPVIMEKVASSGQQSNRLLSRRKSLDPVRFREVKRGPFQPSAQEEEVDIVESSEQVIEVQPSPATTNDLDNAPNLTRLMTNQPVSEKIRHRPDSSMSFSSTATTSCSLSISEADSGVDVGMAVVAKPSPSTVRPILPRDQDQFPKIGERRGKGLPSSTPLETPSKRTKRTDKAKLLRTNSDLAGKLTTDGDIEIEDFD